MNLRLVAVDEHALLRLGLAGMAAGYGDIQLVGEAASVAEALTVVEQVRPDVVTFDVTLPDGDGFALARRLRARYPGLGLVLVSSSNDEALAYRAMDDGLSAYVAKSSPATAVLAAIRHAAVAPESFTAPAMAGVLSRRRSSAGLLSQRERQVLALMRDGISLPGIAIALSVSEATVKTYVARLYTKLRVNNRSQALMAAVNQGLLSTADAA
jgi:DNA-binding NarL/FixJ family response regulator